MNLSKLAINRPISVLMAVMVVLVLGTVSFVRLPVDLFPDMDLPMVIVWTEYEGAGPEEVENMVSRPLEEAIGSLSNLQSMTSRSSAGSSIVLAQFNWGADMDFTSLEMRESVDMVRGFLPAGAGSPMIFRFDPALLPVLQVGMGGDMERAALTTLANDVVKNRLERIEGVAAVSVEGGLVSEVDVRVDLQRLAATGVPLAQLEQALVTENLNFVGGEFSAGGRQFQVRTLGQFRSLEEMEGIVIGQDGGGAVFLRDVAAVQLAYKEDQVISRMNGQNIVSLNVRKQSDSNTVRVAAAVQREMQLLENELPGNVHFIIAIDTSEFIVVAINNVITIVLFGALLAILVLFLFLGSFASTLIISTAIPISVIAVFMLMYFRNMTLNILTLGGLALGVGLMVDNAIVILENIYRYRKQGEKPREAAIAGSREVTGAITAATLTTVVVFIPSVFVEGIASIIFAPLAWTVAFALLASLVVAVTVVPALSARVSSFEQQHRGIVNISHNAMQRFLDKAYHFYGILLEKALRRRWLVVGLVMGALLLSLTMIPLIGYEFLPSDDSGMIFVKLDLPVGSSLQETGDVAMDIEELIGGGAYPEVETVFSSIGTEGGFFESLTPEKGLLYLSLVGQGERRATTSMVAERLRRDLGQVPGVDITVEDQDMLSGGFGGDAAPINIAVKGDDLEILQEISAEVARIVEGVEGTREISTSFAHGRPEVHVRLDRERAAALGVSTAQVASVVRTSLDGNVITRYRVGGSEYDVRVKGSEILAVTDLGNLRMLPLLTPHGQSIPLGQVAEVEMGTGPQTIIRENQVRTAYVQGQLWERDIGSVMRDVQQQLATLDLPLGFSLEYGGELADIQESYASLGLALALSIVLVYMIMAAQFESLLFPFIIMFALPQTFIGILLALVITGKALSVPAFIGVIMLSGIVVNNGIVLVDYINILRRERGYKRDDAIREAGPVRLRPILMTTATTILGMLPLAMGLGEGADVQAPMAIVIVGGLAVSTIITLIFVPVVYTLLDDLGIWIQGTRSKKQEAGGRR